ncbi:MAG: prepilin-type N-terminal cleavage/methylation domain-containing protein [Bacilli bacterium]
MNKFIKSIKKGFTLVELVVVIAIIAILAAVSVGGYFIYIGQAQSAELTTIKSEINTKVNTLVTGREIGDYVFTFEAKKGLVITPKSGITVAAPQEKSNLGIIELLSTDRTDKENSVGATDGKGGKFAASLSAVTDITKPTDKGIVETITTAIPTADAPASVKDKTGNLIKGVRGIWVKTAVESDGSTTLLAKQVVYVSSYYQAIVIDIA